MTTSPPSQDFGRHIYNFWRKYYKSYMTRASVSIHLSVNGALRRQNFWDTGSYLMASNPYTRKLMQFFVYNLQPMSKNLVRVESTRSEEVSRKFRNTWLARYPLPEKIISDNGPKFVSHEWEFMLADWGVRHGHISRHTLTAN